MCSSDLQGLVSGVKTQMVSDKISVVTIKVSDRVRRLELLGKHISVGAFRDNIGLTGGDGQDLTLTVNFVSDKS